MSNIGVVKANIYADNIDLTVTLFVSGAGNEVLGLAELAEIHASADAISGSLSHGGFGASGSSSFSKEGSASGSFGKRIPCLAG